MDKQSTTRFSNRVEDYVKFRPGYPSAILSYLQQEIGLGPDKLIADIGSGTGISSELFLRAGYRVFGVEPNKEMREKSVELLNDQPAFTAVEGTAENTQLDAASMDAVVAGQAFHWFNLPLAQREFSRILRPGGVVVLIFNERLTNSAFEKDYEALIIRHARDYIKVDHRNLSEEKLKPFFQPGSFRRRVFANKQVFNFTGLKGRLLSSSYMPAEGDPGHAEMIDELETLFALHQQDGLITIHYDTNVDTGFISVEHSAAG